MIQVDSIPCHDDLWSLAHLYHLWRLRFFGAAEQVKTVIYKETRLKTKNKWEALQRQ
jgi:hypothetical protein